MNINIIQSKEMQKRKNETYWKFIWKKHLNTFLILLSCSSFFIFVGVQNFIFFNEEFRNYSQFNQVSIYSLFIIGLISLLFCAFQLKNYYKEKRIFFEKIKEIPESKIQITDEFITIDSSQSNKSFKWDSIKHFSIIDDCLFLTQFNDKRNFEIIINIEPLNKTEKKDLINFMLVKR
ncbi:MAG: hypothetical protein K0M56_04505 [Kaistella sp.]|nr:hypothetical protein [Kaistella sp.]